MLLFEALFLLRPFNQFEWFSFQTLSLGKTNIRYPKSTINAKVCHFASFIFLISSASHLFLYMYSILTNCINHPSVTFPEGSECELKDGTLAVCKSFVLCRWAIQGLNQRVISYSDINRCSFEVN